MKKIFTIFCLLWMSTLNAQNAYYAARLSAVTQKSPPQITLNWKMPPAVTNGNITIYKKAKSATNWTTVTQLPGTTNSYIDKAVTAGGAFEYAITKDDTTQPYGYIYAGIEEPPIHSRGVILLLVDDLFTTPCSAELSTLMNDLSGDGWEVIRKDFNRTATVATVKSFITTTAAADKNLAAIYIIGHIAVPYSGELNPDGHTDHIGAWPADAYYGDIDGTWTDVSVNNVSASNPLNHNTPGDGNFDPSYMASDIELQVGRVDFYDMPAFSKTEVQLMQSYLNKAHQYKVGALSVIKRGIVDDNFKTYPEGFAGNGWRNFAPLVGTDSVTEKDILTNVNTGFYQWAYGCGGGTFTSCGGVGNTTDIVTKNMKTIFTMFFGSYFGDWNYKNNFLRAPLCADEPALTSFWAGRPNWELHHMALGENIGYATKLSQNNSSTYITPIPSLSRTVNVALMGDPSLRTEYVKPVPAISLVADPNAGAIVSWTASPEPGVAGYYVYRSTSEFGAYQLRNATMVTGTTYTDSFGTEGTYWYMVRAAKLQATPSGTYYNLGLGISKSSTFKYPYFDVGIGAVSVLTDAQLYPNPAKESVQLSIGSIRQVNAGVSITDLQGRVLINNNMLLDPGNNTQQLNISSLPSGMYMVNIYTGTETKTLKLAKTY